MSNVEVEGIVFHFNIEHSPFNIHIVMVFNSLYCTFNIEIEIFVFNFDIQSSTFNIQYFEVHTPKKTAMRFKP